MPTLRESYASTRPGRSGVLGLILLVSAVLQFYRLGDWQSFSDDQALQMNVMHGLLVDSHLPAYGMALSVGQAHMGPLFYYLLALPLWIGHLDPTAGVALVGLFQVATVYLVYRLFLLIEAPWAGLCAAGLYATSGLVVYWSRFLWPNVAPFFVVLALYALVAIALGHTRYIVMLAGSLAAAAQMQPTAVLLIPVAVPWLVAWRPRFGLRQVGLAAGLVVLLFAPSIVNDATHHFAETRAWLQYATVVRPGGAQQSGIGPGRGLGALATFGRRALGIHSQAWAMALLLLGALAVLLYAFGWAGRERAVLARLLGLWAAVYVLALSAYHGAIHPHYVEPLYPLPFIALGLLCDLIVTLWGRASLLFAGKRPEAKASWQGPGHKWPGQAHDHQWSGGGPSGSGRPARTMQHPERKSPQRHVSGLASYLGTAALVVALAGINVRNLAENQFGLTPDQMDSPAETQGSRVMLGEMRTAVGIIAWSAHGQPYSFLTAVRDGAGAGFQYLQRQADPPPAPRLEPLQFLLVEPADRPPWLWPAQTRGRWAYLSGGFIRLPHLLLWRLRAGALTDRDRGPWRDSADTGGMVTALHANAQGGIVAGFIGGVAMTRENGRWRAATWPHHPPNGLSVITGLAGSAACPRHLYAATFDGVMTSVDGGESWRRPQAQPKSGEILAIWADPVHCGTVLVGTRAGIARSLDGGASWRQMLLGQPHPPAVHALAADTDGRTIYAGATDGVWISTDDGVAWSRLGVRGEPRPALCLLIHPGHRKLLLAGTGHGLVYSGDGGLTWALTGEGLQATVYTLLDADSRGTLLAGTDAGLYRSRDNGATWTRLPVPDDLTVSALAAGTAHHSMYAATNEGLYLSADNGATWIRS